MVYRPISGFTSSEFRAISPIFTPYIQLNNLPGLLPDHLAFTKEERSKLTSSKLSSAHVYLRQSDDQPHGEWDRLPSALVDDAAQLVKANSIEG